MRAHVPLEVKGVVEALAAVAARVPLHQAVALHVAREHALQREHLVAHGAQEVPGAGRHAGARLNTRVHR